MCHTSVVSDRRGQAFYELLCYLTTALPCFKESNNLYFLIFYIMPLELIPLIGQKMIKIATEDADTKETLK